MTNNFNSVAVLGASGSGKSCLLRAGLLYQQDLRSTAIYGAKNYHFQDIATIDSAVA